MACDPTITKKVLYIVPNNPTDPAYGFLFGLDVACQCSGTPGAQGCGSIFFTATMDALDSSCNHSNISSISCTAIIVSLQCGSDDEEIMGISPPPPYWGWVSGTTYCLTITFWEHSGCTAPTSWQLGTLVEYLDYSAGYWSIVGKPAGCP